MNITKWQPVGIGEMIMWEFLVPMALTRGNWQKQWVSVVKQLVSYAQIGAQSRLILC